nr:MerR family transcriptional regulator [Pontibacter silvestris]
MSGVKAHTIRIWEQRYNILTPQRTETNIRYYSDADLKALLNISLLNERGYKISKIAQMDRSQILQTVQQLCDEPNQEGTHQINTLVAAMIDMDEEQFDKTLSTATLQMGFEWTMLHIIYPFLNKIGILWQTNNISPAHEHFVSNLVRQKLIVAIDGQVLRKHAQAPTYLLYLPEGELHELALLYMNYIIRSHHCHVFYLGQNLPFEDLKLTYEQCKPDFICTVMTSAPERDKVQEYLNNLSAAFPGCTVFVYGILIQQDELIFPPNIKVIPDMRSFITLFS